MIDTLEARCEHILHENGIHELILHENGTRGADAYLEQLEHLYQAWANLDEPLLMIVNANGGSLPISYAMQRGKELSARYPARGEIYSATLTDNTMEARIVDTFLRVMRFSGVQVRFFEDRHRADAIKWLLQYR